MAKIASLSAKPLARMVSSAHRNGLRPPKFLTYTTQSRTPRAARRLFTVRSTVLCSMGPRAPTWSVIWLVSFRADFAGGATALALGRAADGDGAPGPGWSA
jgi:hypothetical protein